MRPTKEVTGHLLVLRAALDGEPVSAPTLKHALDGLAAEQPSRVLKLAREQAGILRML